MEQTVEPPQNPVMLTVWQKISELEAMLLKNDPLLPGHIKVIHTNLSQYEELVHLLTDEQIRDIIAVQKTLTNVILAPKIAKTEEKKAKNLAKNYGSASDL